MLKQISLSVSILLILCQFSLSRGLGPKRTNKNDKVPALEQRRSIYDVLEGKLQVTGMGKVLEAIDMKKISKNEADSTFRRAHREKRSDDSGKVIRDDSIELEKSNDSASIFLEADDINLIKFNEKPKNLILLFLDEDEEEILSTSKIVEFFPVRGYLQGFKTNESNDECTKCECRSSLRVSAMELSSWARQARGMLVDSTSIPSFFVSLHPEIEDPYGNSRWYDEWLIDVTENRTTSSVPTFNVDRKNYNTMWEREVHYYPDSNNDVPWTLWAMLLRLKSIFFRNILSETIEKNYNETENEFAWSDESFVRAKPIETILDVARKYESIDHPNGYAIIAAGVGDDIAPAIALLRNKIASNETLLIVTEICSSKKKALRYMASGPGSVVLKKVRSLRQLFAVAKKILDNERSEAKCEHCNDVGTSRVSLNAEKMDPPRKIVEDGNSNFGGAGGKKNFTLREILVGVKNTDLEYRATKWKLP